MVNYAIPILFLMVPFGFLQFGLLHQAHQLSFMLASIVILAWQLRNRAASYFLTYAVSWMVFILVFSMFREVPKAIIAQSMDAVLYLGAGALVFYCVTQSTIKKEIYLNIICIAALAQMGIGISQYLGFDPLTWVLGHFFVTQSLIAGHMTGTLGNNNFLAAFVAISMPFFWRRWWVWAMPIIIYVLYFSNTTSAVVPAILVSAWYFREKLTKREQIFAVSGGSLVVIAYACFQHTPFYLNPRWVDWTLATKQLFYSPFAVFFGMCPGAGWGKSYPMHNEWLQSFHQYGIAGFSMIAAFTYGLLKTNCDRMLKASLLIALINMFGNYSLHLAPSAFLIIIIAGLIEREGRVVACTTPEKGTGHARATK